MKTNVITDFIPSQSTVDNPRNPRKRVDIETLLRWVYVDQAADEVSSKPTARERPDGYSGSSMFAVIRNGMLGTRIDCSGSAMMDRSGLHPDAQLVHDAVMALEPFADGLVREYAWVDRRPDWLSMADIRAAPDLRANGKPRMEYFDPITKRQPYYCLVSFAPSPDHVAFVQRMYEEWWVAVTALVAALPNLSAHEVTGFNAPRAPWSSAVGEGHKVC